nr:uncharacterized protein LOC101241248 isoform X1 [Hydra vulgaris]
MWKAATVENAISGFRVTGINPFNREILPESDYFENPCLKDSNTNIIFNEIADINPEQSSTTNSLIGPNQNSNVQTSIASFSVNEINASLSISNSQQLSFTDILSIPAIEVKTTKRKGEKSEILTSTSYKKTLQEGLENKKKVKYNKKRPTVKKIKLKKDDKIKYGENQKISESSQKCVQCFRCKLWYHEVYFVKLGTDFLCKLCVCHDYI